MTKLYKTRATLCTIGLRKCANIYVMASTFVGVETTISQQVFKDKKRENLNMMCPTKDINGTEFCYSLLWKMKLIRSGSPLSSRATSAMSF